MKFTFFFSSILLMTPFSALATSASTGGGARPTAVYSIERNEGTSTFAVGSYENKKWKIEKLSMPSDSIPEHISDALEKSEQNKDWAQLQE